jgi:cell division protease FtsH
VIIIAATNRPTCWTTRCCARAVSTARSWWRCRPWKGAPASSRSTAKRIKLAQEADLRRIARGTPGFSGADLSNLVNEAALLAARRGAESVELQGPGGGARQGALGPRAAQPLLDDTEKKLTAYHEAGHAIVLALVEEGEPLHKVTIIPRGQSLGPRCSCPRRTATRRASASCWACWWA